MQLLVLDGKETLCSNVETWELFKKWVENTSLFHAILNDSGNPQMTIEAFTPEEYMSLNLNFTKISTFEELPKELLIKFYLNSPWNNPGKTLKQINDENEPQNQIAT